MPWPSPAKSSPSSPPPPPNPPDSCAPSTPPLAPSLVLWTQVPEQTAWEHQSRCSPKSREITLINSFAKKVM